MSTYHHSKINSTSVVAKIESSYRYLFQIVVTDETNNINKKSRVPNLMRPTGSSSQKIKLARTCKVPPNTHRLKPHALWISKRYLGGFRIMRGFVTIQYKYKLTCIIDLFIFGYHCSLEMFNIKFTISTLILCLGLLASVNAVPQSSVSHCKYWALWTLKLTS